MKQTKKVAISIFTVLLIVLMSVPTNADILSTSKVTTTIDPQLQLILKGAFTDQRIPVDIWLYEASTVEEREQKIFSKIGISKAQITSDTKGILTSKQVDEYITTERSMYAEERERQYTAIRSEYSNVKGLREERQANTRLFYSQYAPMISAELTAAEIQLLACDSRVQSISYSPNVTLKDEGDVSLPTIGANYVRDTLGYTGRGIKIGMVESSLPNKNADYFISDNIHYDPNVDEVGTNQSHANRVAAIMVGQFHAEGEVAYEGIVPEAQLYATRFQGGNTVDWRSRVEWLLSQGVHVINMSAHLPEASQGYYGEQERWIDHIAINHSVHFVKASGNTGWNVTAPGMAYNIITVGSIDDHNTPNDMIDDELAGGSSYGEHPDTITGVYPTNKPDLVAPGESIATAAGTDSGTSYAAPHVTAVVAQVCQFIPSLKVLQPVVKAVLTASVSHGVHAYTPTDDEYDQFGAGVINAKAAFETLYAYRMMGGNFPAGSAANAEKTYTFTATAGQRVRVSLTWLKYSTISNDVLHPSYDPPDYDLADLDLYVIHPEGADINYSTEIYNNTEIIDFVAPTAGTYQIVVTNRLFTEQVVNYGVAWWFNMSNN